ncbi:hypothetical protein H4R27_004581 [Coemansia aciculifera]|nr:hypothetical protein H4R27_004581 [Coemansia aciculifera]
MTTSQKYLLNHVYMTRADSYSTFEPYDPQPKTQVELRMIRASAAIRFTPDWVEKLHSDSKRKEWTVQVKKAFGLNKREVEYVFNDQGEEDGELANEFGRNAELLEDDYAKGQFEGMGGNKPSDRQVLVDPFMYAFASDESQIFKYVITSPLDAVNSEMPRIKPNKYWKWAKAIAIHNEYNTHNRETMFDKRKISDLS